MELVFILSVVLLQILFVNLLQIVEIVRAVRIYTFMEDEVFPFLLSHKRIAAVRAAKGKLLGETVFSGREVRTTDLTAKLPCFAVVAVEIRFRSTAGRATAVIGDVTGFAPDDGPDILIIAMLEVRDEELPVPVMLVEQDPWKFINLELLVFRGMGVIKRPLFEWDVSADKI